ncbi:MAG: endonuclease/exonuclease/phosphatase family protein [Syntrophales bacterium]
MKLITWNINHRARRKHIPPSMAAAITSLSPDVIILTEYVPGPSHESFMEELATRGLGHISMSPYAYRENQILIAANSHLASGVLEAPAIAASVPSNFIHVHVRDNGLNIIGMRVPDYSKQPLIRHRCWDWIESIAKGMVKEPCVLMGDFNTDQSYPPSRCGNRLSNIVTAGWQHAIPSLGSSYLPVTGGSGKKLDHAFVTEHFLIRSAEYIWESNGYVFAGKVPGALSDHAVQQVVEKLFHINRRNLTGSVKYFV